jgi:type I restriction enzyme, R subunit
MDQARANRAQDRTCLATAERDVAASQGADDLQHSGTGGTGALRLLHLDATLADTSDPRRLAAAEASFEEAKAKGNEAGIKQADATRAAHDQALMELMDFKSGLTRFGSLYTYVAQTIDFGDPGLEAFSSFSRLLSKRLDGVPPDQVDLSALVLTGFDVKPTDKPDTGATPSSDTAILTPIGPGGGGQAAAPVYLKQIIARLNSIFGQASPLADQVAMVNQVADIAREDATTMAQVANNPRDVAMNGNIKGTVQAR